MATSDESSASELRAEIERLTQELDLVSTEKIQSAQYGLALLEEKSGLEQRCNDLESLYENARHELEITQEVSRRDFLVLSVGSVDVRLAADFSFVSDSDDCSDGFGVGGFCGSLIVYCFWVGRITDVSFQLTRILSIGSCNFHK